MHGRDPLEDRLSNLQNYCRYLGDQPGQIAVQELGKMHAKLLVKNMVTKPINDRKVTKASDLKIGQLVFVNNHHKGPFDPTYTSDHKISAIVNTSTVVLTTQDGREKGCNIHHIMPTSALELSASAFDQFQDGIQKDPINTQYNLHVRNN